MHDTDEEFQVTGLLEHLAQLNATLVLEASRVGWRGKIVAGATVLADTESGPSPMWCFHGLVHLLSTENFGLHLPPTCLVSAETGDALVAQLNQSPGELLVRVTSTGQDYRATFILDGAEMAGAPLNSEYLYSLLEAVRRELAVLAATGVAA